MCDAVNITDLDHGINASSDSRRWERIPYRIELNAKGKTEVVCEAWVFTPLPEMVDKGKI